MLQEPYFLDINGHTVRVDPPNAGKFIKVSIFTCVEYNDAGDITFRGQNVQLWINADQAKRLADIFTVIANPDMNKLMGAS